MSAFWDGPVYADVEREARHDWLIERPQPAPPSPSEYDACCQCQQFVCDCGNQETP
jgi:hypothetical protein